MRVSVLRGRRRAECRHADKRIEPERLDPDAVRVLLEQRREQAVPLFPLDGRPHLKGVAVPTPDLQAYHALCTGGES